ncbi:MAG: hypothetical protein QNJ34_06250 [Xenococcaceae cyanobacterium MO_188.B29]|nr:hypothetical protein [Xenococcaceae cyanobacterium MO_188.B29]
MTGVPQLINRQTLVLDNSSNDLSNNAIDLDSFSLNSDGFFLLGNPGIANADTVSNYNIRQNNTATFVAQITVPSEENEAVLDPPNLELISNIQGSRNASTLINQTVTVEAIVVGDFQGEDGLRGFYLQEENTDIDSNAATSEGIFVFDGNLPGVDVAIGDKVQVTGIVDESFESGLFHASSNAPRN